MPRRPSPETLAQLVAATAALLAFAGALANGFAWDDWPAIVNDTGLRDLTALPRRLQQPYWPSTGTLWRPLTTLSYAVDWAWGGGAPLAFHVVNWLLHALASALVTRLALRWLDPAAAAAAGLVFALAPVHVEVVANAVGRAELLCAIGLLGVLLAATRPGTPTVPQLRLVAASAFLALGAKETGAVAPVLALAANWLVTRTPRAAWRTAWWAATPVAALLVGRRLVLGTIAGDAPHPAWWVANGIEGVWLALATLPKALWMLVIPQPGAWEHSPTLAQARSPSVLLAGLGVLLLGLAAWQGWRLWRRPSVGALAVVIMVVAWLPVSNLVLRTGVIVAERTLYSPSIGLALGAGVLAGVLGAWRPAAPTALLVGWGALATATVLRDVPAWRDSMTIFETMTARNPDSYKAWWYLGQARRVDDDVPGAYAAMRESLARFDLETRILHAGAQVAMQQGDTAQAVRWLDQSLAIDPNGRRSRTLRVMVAMRRQDKAAALRLLDEGLAREPDQEIWARMRQDIRAWPDPAAPPAAAPPAAAPSAAAPTRTPN